MIQKHVFVRFMHNMMALNSGSLTSLHAPVAYLEQLAVYLVRISNTNKVCRSQLQIMKVRPREIILSQACVELSLEFLPNTTLVNGLTAAESQDIYLACLAELAFLISYFVQLIQVSRSKGVFQSTCFGERYDYEILHGRIIDLVIIILVNLKFASSDIEDCTHLESISRKVRLVSYLQQCYH